MKICLTLFNRILAGTTTAFALCALSALPLRAGIGDIDSNGWTILTPSVDSKLIYVSSSEGDDANDGLSPETPKKTINAANALLFEGLPNWILLKRGDTFTQPNLGRWISGRSAAEPAVITYYGDSGARPIIKLTRTLVDWSGQDRHSQAFVGLDLYQSISDPDSPDFTDASCGLAFRFVSGGSSAGDVLIEDCRLRFCWIDSEGSNNNDNNLIHNMNIRRNIIAYNWVHGSSLSAEGRIQGMYVSGTHDLLIEENIFHHNGWSEVISDAEAAQYSHNIYMSSSNNGNIMVRGNVISYGAANGLQLRSGGTATMNAFIGNSVGMNLGYSNFPTRYTGETYANDNVFTDGRPQVPNDNSNPQSGAIWGLWKQSINNVHVDNNIVANVLDARGTNVKPYADMTADQFGSGNIAWNWTQGNHPASNPGWTDPARNAAKFANSLGFDNYHAWITAAMERPLRTMDIDQTAYAYINYIREGFNKAAVTPPYSFDVIVEPTDWRGEYPYIDDNFADTGEFMGMLYVEQDPWVYVYDLSAWIYLPEGSLEAGSWARVVK